MRRAVGEVGNYLGKRTPRDGRVRPILRLPRSHVAQRSTCKCQLLPDSRDPTDQLGGTVLLNSIDDALHLGKRGVYSNTLEVDRNLTNL